MTGRPDDVHEVEVKLGVVDMEAAVTILRQPRPERLGGFAAAGPPREVTVLDRYFDTSLGGGRLQAAAMRARLRQVDGTVVLAVKRAGIEADGVTTRLELEGPATTDLDPARWPESEARAALLQVTGDAALVEIATLRQRRLQRHLRRGNTLVELSIDLVEALDGDRVADRRVELELELLEGYGDDLRQLAETVTQLPGIGSAHGPKLEFAIRARSGVEE
jgi:inorganic triphosphatase YgiF